MTGEHYLAIGIASCASAIVFLFGLEMKHHAATREEWTRTRERLDKCETDRIALSVRIAVLEVPARRIEETANAAAATLKLVATEVATQLRMEHDRLSGENK